MVQLSKRTSPLLKTVKGKPHATDDDHESGLPTPPASNKLTRMDEIDITRSPVSSDDEQETRTTDQNDSKKATQYAHKDEDEDDDADSEDWSFIAKRRPPNIDKGTGHKKAKTMKYGSQNSKSSQQIPKKQFKKPPAEKKKVETAKFIVARAAESSAAAADTISSSPPKSPSTEAGYEEILTLDKTSRCEICEEVVDPLIRQEYEDKYQGVASAGRQHAFCHYHKRKTAEVEWQDRGYPEIDWHQLEEKMELQHTRLRRLINTSHRRDAVLKQIGKRLTASERLQTGDLGTCSVGYYGPRGHRLMVEHISTHLAPELRSSYKDSIITAAGVAGGVSGFVQGILVPEMAIGLIMDDLNVEQDKAEELLEESSLLGEILNDEQRDVIDEIM